MKVNNISFTSKINFVDGKTFDKYRRGTYIDIRKMYSAAKNEQIIPGIVKADEFYTDEIRTCTAGGLVNTKTGEAIGFHYFDDLTNSSKVNELLKNLFDSIKNPDRALILGSKNLKFSIYSLPIFKEIYEGISKRVQNITMFREHTFPYSETDFHYSLKDDTWTLHSMFRQRTDIKDYDVTSQNLMNDAFEEIKLANGDSLFFNGKCIK